MFNVYDRGQASQLLKEVKMLLSVDCDALISLKGAFHNEGTIGIIIEYMDRSYTPSYDHLCLYLKLSVLYTYRGSLDFLMGKDWVITEAVFASIVYQVVWGLGYLHFDNRLHRDIKPANILLNSLGQVKLSDFGISKELDSSSAMSTTSVGTFKVHLQLTS